MIQIQLLVKYQPVTVIFGLEQLIQQVEFMIVYLQILVAVIV